MSDSTPITPGSAGEQAAWRQGWRAGLALGALALAVDAFINLLGAEKSVLAIVLALVAIRGAAAGATRTRGRVAVALAALHLIVLATVLIVFHAKLWQLLSLLKTLG